MASGRVEAQGRIGEVLARTSGEETMRLGPLLDVIMSELHGRYFEAVRTGRVFTVGGTIAGFAGAATHVSPLAAGTGTPVIGIYNPVGSGKVASIIMAQFVIAAVADTAVGLPVWNIIPAAGAPGITATGNVTPLPNIVGQGGASAMRGFTNSALTGSVAASYLRHLAPSSVQVAIATATAFTMMTENTDGGILVPPGAFAGLALSAAGTTYNVSGDLTYEELDLAVLP